MQVTNKSRTISLLYNYMHIDMKLSFLKEMQFKTSASHSLIMNNMKLNYERNFSVLVSKIIDKIKYGVVKY